MELQIIFLAELFLLTISGAFINRWRGGWEISWIKIESHQIKRLVVCIIPTLSLLLPFYDVADWYIWPICYLLFLIIGIVPGWGSWFFIGRDKDSWKHNEDAFWVEPICFLFYGYKWIPADKKDLSDKELNNIKGRFNYRNSPTGEVRPLQWRIKMEKLAMSIRGLGITIPVSIFLLFYFDCYSFIIIAPVGYLMGCCYAIGFYLDLNRFPSWLSITTNVGEFLTGGLIFGAGIFLTSSIASLFLNIP